MSLVDVAVREDDIVYAVLNRLLGSLAEVSECLVQTSFAL